jgi:uncharacterized protein with von Willebrand factor type A (vWA) domain
MGEMVDEVQVVAQAVQAARRDDDIPAKHFLLSTEYFPVTRRQMKQSLRYLRRMVREGPRTELDVEATVSKIGRQGVILEPVLVPARMNRTELLLLLDQDGSMVPFHILSRRLAETALRGGRLGKAGIYYFHNCPTDYLYRDSVLYEEESLDDVITQVHHERTVALIFSDAGAARGGFNQERVELTETFLNRLKPQVRHVAWLNPMPRSRWLGTTANSVACLVPMVAFSRRGLDDAIDVLRGRGVHLSGE